MTRAQEAAQIYRDIYAEICEKEERGEDIVVTDEIERFDNEGISDEERELLIMISQEIQDAIVSDREVIAFMRAAAKLL